MSRQLCSSFLFLLLGCAAPPAQPLDPDLLSTSLEERSLAVAGAGESFFHAASSRYHPDVLSAQHRLAEARAASTAARAAGPLRFGLEHAAAPGGQAGETELNLSFDLLGVLGLGRFPAAALLAQAVEARAAADLELAAFAARHAVDRALAGLAAAAGERSALLAFQAEAEADRPRIDLLRERGWLAEARASEALAALLRLEHALAEADAREATGRAALAALSGLPPEAAALDGVDVTWLERVTQRVLPETPALEQLLARHPALRRHVTDYAVAEAEVRKAAATAWPEIRIGPRAVFQPDAALFGGLLDVEAIDPRARSGLLAAATARRAAARSRLEQAVLEIQGSIERGLALAAGARAAGLRVAAERARHEAARWRAARALFVTDAAALAEWSMALAGAIEAQASLAAASEALARVRVDLDEALGAEGGEP
ncbi:MAG: hypothetical protein HY812_08110 [Planctomycetes bacterium]|nr:hypothetical protein [Planctomycetota bacterium]